MEGVGRKINFNEQIAIIDLFKECGFRDDDVSLDHPELVFKVIENTPDKMAYFGLIVAAFKDMRKSDTGKKQ